METLVVLLSTGFRCLDPLLLVSEMSHLPVATLFTLGNLTVMPFWALMILAPGWSRTSQAMRSPLVAIGPALIYALLVAPALPSLLAMLMRPTLGDVAALLGTERGATIGWVHFLAFDLLVGRRVFLDARERGVPAWVSSPVLFFVLMLGPLGWLAHLGVSRAFGATRGEGPGQGEKR